MRDEYGMICFLSQTKDRSESGWWSQIRCAMWEIVKQAEGVESDECWKMTRAVSQIPSGADTYLSPISTKDKRGLHQSGTKRFHDFF